jgi:uncharacterized protein (DUF362 family)
MKILNSKFSRRQFLKGAAAALALPKAFSLNPLVKPFTPSSAGEALDFVVAGKGSPGQLLRAVMAPLGGMGRFVKKGQRVVVKANFAWARTPEQACTNNPELLDALIRMIYEAGAKKVAVWDHTCDNYQFCLIRSGLKKTAENAGADIFSGHGLNVYQEVTSSRAKKLKTMLFIKDALESDVLINLPLPKQHFATEVTLGLKNMMGLTWDMEGLHKIDLHQCIADISTVRRPDLVVMDAIRILTTNGPKGPGRTEDPGLVIAGTDVVAVDAYTVSLFKNPRTGKPYLPAEIAFIKNAHDLGLGEIDLAKVRMKKVLAA